MSFSSKMDKENTVTGARRVKSAPNFSKLHKQWDAKLQKGKAVRKKPLTEVQPFQLTHSSKPNSPSSYVNNDDFATDPDAKENILNGRTFHEVETYKPQRATIGVTGRSAIPRPSFTATTRSSMYTKERYTKIASPSLLSPSVTNTPKTQQKVLTKQTINKEIESSAVSIQQNLQGFKVDFKTDAGALDSILNGKGIESLPTSPNRLSSQFGPSMKPRVKGRIVPFSRPSAAGRLNGRKTQGNGIPMNSAKQRWSIYTSRDSYSSKPDLMDWLQKMIDDSKLKKFAAKQNSTLTNSTLTNTTKVNTSAITTTYNISETSMKKSNITTEETPNNQKNSFLFRKTLVGYQGDEGSKSPKDLSRVQSVSSLRKESNVVTKNDNRTPVKVNSLPTCNNQSMVKSILKKQKPKLPDVMDETPSKETPIASRLRNSTKNSTVKSLKLAGTPLRLSAYSRQQLRQGLPLPKENRYEKFGESITGSSITKEADSCNSPKVTKEEKLDCQKLLGQSAVKSVRWADDIKESKDQRTMEMEVPDATHVAHQTTNSVTKEASFLNVKNRKHSPVARINRNNTTNSFVDSTKSITSFHSHQIKYVMPAEQPMEKTGNHSSRQCSKSLFQQTIGGEVDLLQLHDDQSNYPTPLISKETTQTEKKDLKSWAQVLDEELNTSLKIKRSIDNHKLVTTSTTMNTLGGNQNQSVKPKKRNKNRISILEQIYGDDIKFKDESPDNTTTSRFTNTSSLCSSNMNTSLGLGIRPIPSIGEKLIGDLMGFHDDSDSDGGFEECSYFAKMEADGEKTECEPFQSTMLGTPVENNKMHQTVIMGLTPVLDTGKKVPIAPCKQLTKARTPYKQEMLDVLERTLAAARQKKNEDTLDCTINHGNTTVITMDESKTCDTMMAENDERILSFMNDQTANISCSNKTLIDKAGKSYDSTLKIAESTLPSQFYETEKPCVSTSYLNTSNCVPTSGISSNDEISNLTDSTLKTLKHHTTTLPSSNVNIINIKDPEVPDICSSSMSLFSDVQTRKPIDIGLFTRKSDTTESLVTNTLLPTNFASTTTTFSPKCSLVKPASFTVQHRTSPILSTRSSETSCHGFSSSSTNTLNKFPAPALFSSMSKDIKFTSNDRSFIKMEKDIFPPSFSSLNKSSAPVSFSTLSKQSIIKNDRNLNVSSYNTTTQSFKQFPAPPLFSSMSREMKFSTKNCKNLDKSDNDEVTLLLKPSKLSNPTVSTNKSSTKQLFSSGTPRLDKPQTIDILQSLKINDSTCNESTFFDECDVCMVFKKPEKQETQNSKPKPVFGELNFFNPMGKASGIANNKQSAFCRIESPIIIGSAFRRVTPSQDYISILPNSASEEMKAIHALRFGDMNTGNNNIGLETEVAMYNKIGQINKERGDKVNGVRDGAVNVVALILMYGDSKHFVPVDYENE